MLDRTNIHFKKAVNAVLVKVSRIHNNTMSVYINKKFIDIAMFDNNSDVFYSDMISDYLSKDEILQKLENFNKMYHAWVQLQKKGGSHE
jgi:hypothetical protein